MCNTKNWIQRASTATVLVLLGLLGGCREKAPPQATAADVEATQQEAQHEVEQAKNRGKKRYQK